MEKACHANHISDIHSDYDNVTQTQAFPRSTYSSQPISSNLSTFPITSLSILFMYSCISPTNLGIPADKILTANKAALVLLLIATVATGIPRYSNQGLPKVLLKKSNDITGIWTILYSESTPSTPPLPCTRTGTPMTGNGVTAATIPGR